jgi:GT2 family glycosyltransferase
VNILLETSRPYFDDALPLVSVVVVNFNGRESLLQCLLSVRKSVYSNFETVIVDNGSRDGSLDEVTRTFGDDPRIKMVRCNANLGLARARNLGVQVANGRIIAFLDNDAVPDARWLAEVVKVFTGDNTIGACQSKLLTMKDPTRFDCAGDYLTQFGFLLRRVEYGTADTGQFDTVQEIFSAKGASIIVRRDVLHQVDGFDPDYFMFVEETDLCWRIWLTGFRVLYIPNSVVYHRFGMTKDIAPSLSSFLVKYHGPKNYLATIVKNAGFSLGLRMIPLHLSIWTATIMVLLFKRRGREAVLVGRGLAWNILHLSSLQRKRQLVQHRIRRVSDSTIMSRIMRPMSIEYLLKRANDLSVW